MPHDVVITNLSSYDIINFKFKKTTTNALTNNRIVFAWKYSKVGAQPLKITFITWRRVWELYNAMQ